MHHQWVWKLRQEAGGRSTLRTALVQRSRGGRAAENGAAFRSSLTGKRRALDSGQIPQTSGPGPACSGLVGEVWKHMSGALAAFPWSCPESRMLCEFCKIGKGEILEVGDSAICLLGRLLQKKYFVFLHSWHFLGKFFWDLRSWVKNKLWKLIGNCVKSEITPEKFT